MHYRKQADGLSWLVFDKTTDGERKVALIRIDPTSNPVQTTIERLDASEAELPEVEATAATIRKKWEESNLKICLACMSPTVRRYIEALVDHLGLKDRVIYRDYAECSSETMCESLVKDMYWQELKGEVEFREVWLIADRERRPLQLFDGDLSKKLKGIHTAFTHPSFERWLLLHLPEYDGQLPYDREAVVSSEERIEQISPGRVRKTLVKDVECSASASACRRRFVELMPEFDVVKLTHHRRLLCHLDLALTRAAEEGQSAEPEFPTEMPLLFSRLCRLARRKPEAVLASLAQLPSAVDEPDCKADTDAISVVMPADVKADQPVRKPDTGPLPVRLSIPRDEGDEVLQAVFSEGTAWQKAPIRTLSEYDIRKGRVYLECLRIWAERVYREKAGKDPVLTPEMLKDESVLAFGKDYQAGQTAYRHINNLRSRVGALIKKKTDLTSAGHLTTCAETHLVSVLFEQALKDKAGPYALGFDDPQAYRELLRACIGLHRDLPGIWDTKAGDCGLDEVMRVVSSLECIVPWASALYENVAGKAFKNEERIKALREESSVDNVKNRSAVLTRFADTLITAVDTALMYGKDTNVAQLEDLLSLAPVILSQLSLLVVGATDV